MRLAAHARALGLPVKRSLSHFRFFLRFFENEQPIFYNMICTQITLHGSNQSVFIFTTWENFGANSVAVSLSAAVWSMPHCRVLWFFSINYLRKNLPARALTGAAIALPPSPSAPPQRSLTRLRAAVSSRLLAPTGTSRMSRASPRVRGSCRGILVTRLL